MVQLARSLTSMLHTVDGTRLGVDGVLFGNWGGLLNPVLFQLFAQ